MEDYYKNLVKKNQKKECSSIGLFLFISLSLATVITFFIAIILVFINPASINDTNVNLFINGIISIICFFLLGIAFCKITKTNLNEVIVFKKINKKHLFPLLMFGFSATFVSNLLGAILDSIVSTFGLTTNLEMDYGNLEIFEIILMVLTVSIIPALVEEFLFRGIILGKLRKRGEEFAILISAILFGMMHGNLEQIPFAFMVGLILGFVTVKTNSLLPGIIIHFFNNFISVVFTVLTENNILTETAMNICYYVLVLLFLIAGVISLCYLAKDKSYFKFKPRNEILTFKEKLSATFLNAGIILFTINIIGSTILYIFIT